MKAAIIGLERVNYEKKDGTTVDAHNIHLERKDKNVVGMATEVVYISAIQAKNLGLKLREDEYETYIGAPVNVDYNSRGFLTGFELLDE